MTVPTLIEDMTGNITIQDGVRITYNSATNLPIPAATQPYILAGTGVPAFTAPQNSLFIRTDGGAGARLYANSTGAAVWVVVGSAS